MVIAFVGGIAAHNENALIGEYIYLGKKSPFRHYFLKLKNSSHTKMFAS